MAFNGKSKVTLRSAGQVITEQFNAVPQGAELKSVTIVGADGANKETFLAPAADDSVLLTITYTR
jgi:hypothetical protein